MIAAAGAGATYLLEYAAYVDFGKWTPLVVMMASILVNLLNKWIADTRPMPDPWMSPDAGSGMHK